MEDTVGIIAAVQLEAACDAARNVGQLVKNIGDAELDIDDGLPREPAHGRRAEVVDSQGDVAEVARESLTTPLKQTWPAAVLGTMFNLVARSNRGHLLDSRPDHVQGARRRILSFTMRELVGLDSLVLGNEDVHVHDGHAVAFTLSPQVPAQEEIINRLRWIPPD